MNRSRIRAFWRIVVVAVVAAIAALASPAIAQAVNVATAAKPPAAKAAAFDATPCLGCHAPVKALYDSGGTKEGARSQ